MKIRHRALQFPGDLFHFITVCAHCLYLCQDFLNVCIHLLVVSGIFLTDSTEAADIAQNILFLL